MGINESLKHANTQVIQKRTIDYAFWARLDFWTLEEFAAVAVGLDPDEMRLRLSGKQMLSEGKYGHFQKVFRLILRSKNSGTLTERVPPRRGLRWLEQKGIEPPYALEREVKTYDRSVDWQLECIKQEEMFRTQIVSMETKIRALTVPQSISHDNDNVASEVHPKRLISMFKVITILAVDRGYNPNKGRSDIHSKVVSAGALMDVNIDVDTVRSVLRESAEKVPPDQRYFD